MGAETSCLRKTLGSHYLSNEGNAATSASTYRTRGKAEFAERESHKQREGESVIPKESPLRRNQKKHLSRGGRSHYVKWDKRACEEGGEGGTI